MAKIGEWEEEIAGKETLFLQKVNHAIAELLLWPMFSQEFEGVRQVQAVVNGELIGRT